MLGGEGTPTSAQGHSSYNDWPGAGWRVLCWAWQWWGPLGPALVMLGHLQCRDGNRPAAEPATGPHCSLGHALWKGDRLTPHAMRHPDHRPVPHASSSELLQKFVAPECNGLPE